MPTPHPVPDEVLRKIRQVEIKARVLANDALIGTYRSVFRGSGLEFDEVREYAAGDEIRSIDWNVTARMGTPYIKKFREERELNVVLAVDQSASSWFGTANSSKRDLAAEVATLLAVAAERNNDHSALLLFADRVLEWIPARQGHDHILRLVSELVFAAPRRATTSIATAVAHIDKVTKKRSVVFVLSDFLDAGFEAPLTRLARRHDVIAVTLSDPREQELPQAGLIELEDAETSRVGWVDTHDARLREAYALAARQRRKERSRAFARMRVDTVDLSTDRPYVPALMTFFHERTRRS